MISACPQPALGSLQLAGACEKALSGLQFACSKTVRWGHWGTCLGRGGTQLQHHWDTIFDHPELNETLPHTGSHPYSEVSIRTSLLTHPCPPIPAQPLPSPLPHPYPPASLPPTNMDNVSPLKVPEQLLEIANKPGGLTKGQ